MEYVNLGRTGLKVSRFVVGGAHFGQTLSAGEVKQIIHSAWDSGITTFYTGDDYNVGEGERIIGDILKDRRDEIVLMVKAGYRVGAYGNYSQQGGPVDVTEDYVSQRNGKLDYDALWSAGIGPTSRGLNRKHMVKALDASLARLQTDYIDVYMAHFWDATVPIEETIDVLDGFVRAGKVRYLGCAQYNAWQFMQALWTADKASAHRFEVLQANYSMLDRGPQKEILPALSAVGASFFAAITDAGGMLTGRFGRDSERSEGKGARDHYIDPFWNEVSFAAMDKIRDCAAALDRTPLELAQGWLLSQGTVASLWIGPHAPDEIAAQVRALEKPLTSDELSAVDVMLGDLPSTSRS